jgi:hypothetical protein
MMRFPVSSSLLGPDGPVASRKIEFAGGYAGGDGSRTRSALYEDLVAVRAVLFDNQVSEFWQPEVAASA